MNTFKYHTQRNRTINGETIYEVEHAASGKHLGCVSKSYGGANHDRWTAYLPYGRTEDGYRTREAAAYRLLHVLGVNPVAWSALPADPFDGIATVLP